MESLSIEGAELKFHAIGDGEPTIFIHGAFIANTFLPLLSEPDLAESYRLVTYHRRGYAGSSRTLGPISIVQQASDCRALLQHLGVERAHIVGHSFGGSVALQLALDAPGLVHSLALLEPALMLGESANAYQKSLQAGINLFHEAGALVVADEFMEARWTNYRPALDHLLPGAFEQAVDDAETVFECDLPGLLAWQFSVDDLDRIRQPALSVLGGGSLSLSPRFGEVHQLLLDQLPNASGLVVSGGEHFMHVQRPKCVAEALASYWRQHSISSRSL